MFVNARVSSLGHLNVVVGIRSQAGYPLKGVDRVDVYDVAILVGSAG